MSSCDAIDQIAVIDLTFQNQNRPETWHVTLQDGSDGSKVGAEESSRVDG